MSLFIHRTACSDIKCEGKIFSCFRQVVFAVARIDKVPWWDTRRCDYPRGKRQQSVMFHPGFNAWCLWHIPPEATWCVAHLFGTEIKRNHSQQLMLTVNISHLKRSLFKWILNHIHILHSKRKVLAEILSYLKHFFHPHITTFLLFQKLTEAQVREAAHDGGLKSTFWMFSKCRCSVLMIHNSATPWIFQIKKMASGRSSVWISESPRERPLFL